MESFEKHSLFVYKLHSLSYQKLSAIFTILKPHAVHITMAKELSAQLEKQLPSIGCLINLKALEMTVENTIRFLSYEKLNETCLD